MKKLIITAALSLMSYAASAQTDSTASYHLKKAATYRACAIGAGAITAIAATQITSKEEMPVIYLLAASALAFEVASISHTYRAGRSLQFSCGVASVQLRLRF